MDTSKKYIEMCDCPEVWENWGLPPKDDDFYALHGHVYLNATRKLKAEEANEAIHLLRQGQIQEMIPGGEEWVTMPRKYTRRLLEFANSKNYRMFGVSMEQLWLAFCMWEKHQKIWDGEKWIKANRRKE